MNADLPLGDESRGVNNRNGNANGPNDIFKLSQTLRKSIARLSISSKARI